MTSEPVAGHGEPSRQVELPLLVAMFLAVLAYGSVVRNSFFSDDFLHLYDLVNSTFAQFVARTHGGHIYWIRNLVFYACYSLFRTEPAFYYGLAFLTHLLNVFLFYRVVRASTGSARLACFGAVMWGTLPNNQGAIGWYSVYGHALAATFTLSTLARMTAIAAGAEAMRFEPLLWAVSTSIGITCFGVGFGLAAAMPFAAWLILPPSLLRRRAILLLTMVMALLPLMYVAAVRLDGAVHGESVQGGLALLQTLQAWPTQLRLFLHLFVVAASSLVLGPFRPLNAFTPLDYVLALPFGLVFAVLFAAASGAARRKAVAFVLLAAAAYALIALGRAFFVDEGNAGAIAAAPRFHYMGSCALALSLCALLGDAGRARWPGPRLKTGILIAWLLVVLRGLQTGQGIDHHESNGIEAANVLARVRAAVDEAAAGRDVFVPNRKFISIGAFLLADPSFPGWAGVFAIYFPDGWIEGKRVRFVETDPKILERARGGIISGELLVRPEDVPLTARLTEPPRKPRRAGASRRAVPSEGRGKSEGQGLSP